MFIHGTMFAVILPATDVHKIYAKSFYRIHLHMFLDASAVSNSYPLFFFLVKLVENTSNRDSCLTFFKFQKKIVNLRQVIANLINISGV